MHRSLLQLEQSFQPSILSKIDDPLFERYGVELWLKRDDLLHPIISGNKWRKLKYIINHALSEKADTLISMGGVYSNHLHALAFVGQALGLNTIGFIRGGAPDKLTPTLQDLQNFGMSLEFVSRSEYRTLRTYKGCYDLPQLKDGQYWLPEGGAQSLALQGIGELLADTEQPFDVVCVACGTGATLAGLVKHAPTSVSVHGFAALKNAGFLYADVSALLGEPYGNWHIHLDYHGGGFAKASAELLAFIDTFETQQHIVLEPVYTGKLLFGIYDLIKKSYFKPGQRLLAIHTGGLQGKRGFPPCSAC